MDPTQQYGVDAATLQAVEGLPQLQMDAAAIAAAAQQLEAIQAALQQAGGSLANDQAAVAALEHLQNTKPEDYYAHLAAVGAAAASAAAENGAGGVGLDGMQGEMEAAEPAGSTGDKPLTSRFRGVCWNKKNRRWQAAINSSGKYIYLGSFVQEEEAARAFDRAAIRLRGNRAKLNYALSDYMDDQGNLVDDPRLSAHLQNILGKDGGKGGKSTSTDGHDGQGLLGPAGGTQNLLYNQNLAQHILTQGVKSEHYPYSGARKHNYGVLEVPDGCSLIAHIPGDDEAFAVLYVGSNIPPGGAGASVWDGSGAVDLGVFDTDKDARQAAGAMLKLCMFHRHNLLSTIAAATGAAGAGGVDAAAAAAAAAQVGAATASQYGLLLGGTESLGGVASGTDPNDAAAMAAAAAAAAASAAASSGDPQALAQLGLAGLTQNLAGSTDAQNQYKDLFAWIAAYTQRGGLKPEEQQALDGMAAAAAAGAVEGTAGQTEAELAVSAEMMAALMAQAQAQGVKTTREGEADGTVVQAGYDVTANGDEHMSKRARTDDGLAQLKQLSGHKLQDVMRSLFDPKQGA